MQAEGQDPADGHRRDRTWSSRSACSRRSRAAREQLSAGEVGYIIAGIKELQRRAGRRHRHAREQARAPSRCRASRKIKPQVFAGLYPVESNEYEALRDALAKLQLNDAALHFEPEVSQALGLRLPLRLPGPAAHGDRAGAARARVRPGPDHHRADRGLRGAAARRHGDRRSTTREAAGPGAGSRRSASRSSRVTIFMPHEYVGPVITLCSDKRGVQTNMQLPRRARSCSRTSCRWPRS